MIPGVEAMLAQPGLLKPSRDNIHILKTWVKDGVEYAFHATKGLRKRRVNR